MPFVQDPIPNNPFYYPETNWLSTPMGGLIVGGGIFIDNITGTISAGGGGGGVVSRILPGSGIFVSANVGGNVTVTNTGVLSLNAGPGIGITPGIGGSFTITNTLPATSAAGTVTSVATGPGLQGGPITTSGTIQLAPSGVTPGVYSNPTITVDAYGRITLASPGGSFGAGILATAPLAVTSTFPQSISIAASSTSQAGAVQLNDTVTSTSTTQAATPRAVKVAYDLASSAATDATNALTSALNASNAASSAQILATTANTNASAALACATTADSNAATALTTANAAQTTANAAAAAVNNKIPCSVITGKGALIAGTAAGTPASLSVGTDGQVLRACAACASGLAWAAVSSGTVTNVATGTGLTGGPITSSGTIALANTGVSAGSYTLANITVDAQGRITNASSGTPPTSGTVTNVATGTGLTGGPITSTGTIALANTAVTPGTYTYGTFTVDAQGRLTAASSNTPCSGTVTSVATGTGLTGGPITNTGTIALADTAVTAGSYTYGSFTVDAQGRLTAASSGTAPVTSVTGTAPIVSTGGATPAISLADTAVTPGSYTYASITVDAQGRLTSASDGTPPSGGTVTSVVAGTGLTGGTITTSGTIALDVSGVTAGTVNYPSSITVDTYGRVTALGAASNPVTEDDFQAKGDLITGYGVNSYGVLTAGTDGQVLYACSSEASGLCWGTITNCQGTVTDVTAGTGLTGGTITSSGTIALDTTCVIQPSAFTAKGDLLSASAAATPVALTVGTDGQILTACAACTSGLTWTSASAPAIPCSTLVAKGSLVAASAASTPVDLSVGTDGQTLVACAACTSGLTWITPPTPPVDATPTVAGIVLGCTTATNTALGCNALLVVTSSGNTALGGGALENLTTGLFNVGVGCKAVASNVSSNHNVGVGINAARNSLGSNNTAIGHNTIFCATGGCNTVLGFEAGCCITTGNQNVAIGPSVQVASATGSCQLAIGYSLTCNWLTGNSTKAIKPGAGIIDCANSCGTAGQVLASNGANAVCWTTLPNATPTVAGIVLGCTILNNTSLGCNALLGNTSSGNTAVGVNALDASPSGDNNTAVGACALTANTTGVNNTAVGSLALSSTTTGGFNTGIGRDALCSNTVGVCNTAVGYIGGRVLTTGNFNTLLGTGAGCSLTTTSSNVAIGAFAGSAATGGCNIFIGVQSGCVANSGVCNVVIGTYVNALVPSGSCQLAIGYDANQYWLTGTSTKAIKPGAGIIDCVNSCGTVGQYLWTTGANAILWASSSPSDIRDKEVVGSVPTALPVIQQIDPIAYHWKDRETNVAQEEIIYGFSAQQLQEVDSILVDDSDPDHLRVHERKIVPLLVKAIQELTAKVESLEAKLEGNG